MGSEINCLRNNVIFLFYFFSKFMVQNVGMGSRSEEKQESPITMGPETNRLRDVFFFTGCG